jgi:hypothetical protein
MFSLINYLLNNVLLSVSKRNPLKQQILLKYLKKPA